MLKRPSGALIGPSSGGAWYPSIVAQMARVGGGRCARGGKSGQVRDMDEGGVGSAVLAGRTPTAKRRLRKAGEDLRQTFVGWRLWSTLAANDIAQRYRRSRIGQFWITVSMAMFVAGVGSVYALLFRMNVRDHLPYVVVFFTAWSFLSSTASEGATAFIDAERYLRQERLPKLAFVMRVVWRNFVAYLHNLVLVPIIFLLCGQGITPIALAALAGIALAVVNVTLLATILALLCVRFRDVRQVVLNGLQLVFFASPIMWRSEVLPPEARAIVTFNPAAAHLRMIGEPLLGRLPDLDVYLVSGLCTLLLAAIAIPLFARFRERIVYWL